MPQHVIFQLIGFVEADVGQTRLGESHDRLVRKTIAGNQKCRTNELQQRMVRGGAAAIGKMRQFVLGETGANRLVVFVQISHQHGDVTQTKPAAQRGANSPGYGVDFGGQIGSVEKLNRSFRVNWRGRRGEKIFLQLSQRHGIESLGLRKNQRRIDWNIGLRSAQWSER